MHNLLKVFFFISLLSISSCALFKSNPQKKFDNAQKQEQKAEKAIEAKTDQITDKGKSFVFGAKYSNEKETNRTAPIDISGRFLDLAQLTLGPPNLQDSITIRKIADELIDSYKAETEEAKKAKIKAEKDLQAYVNQVVTLQKDKDNLVKIYQDKVEKLEKINQDNSVKAGQYDQDHSFINTINPFYGLGSMIKKLFIWGLIIGFLMAAFRLLEIFFPQFTILGTIMGGIGKLVFKFFPSASKAAGVVSNKVWDFSKKTILSIEKTLEKLEKNDIESDLIKNYSEDYGFNKKEVLAILQAHSEQIEAILKKELTQKYNEIDQAILNKAKITLGLKQQAENVAI